MTSASREDFLRLSAFQDATIAQLQDAMAAGHLSAAALVDRYTQRIARLDWHGPHLNSVLELNPDARRIAEELDEERRTRGPRGPLHGIPQARGRDDLT